MNLEIIKEYLKDRLDSVGINTLPFIVPAPAQEDIIKSTYGTWANERVSVRFVFAKGCETQEELQALNIFRAIMKGLLKEGAPSMTAALTVEWANETDFFARLDFVSDRYPLERLKRLKQRAQHAI